jgi:wobble nucleotide-excising tRNase
MGNTLKEIAQQLKDSPKKVQLIYAFNGVGKTRLSREFKELITPNIEEEDGDNSELSKKNILYYSAFTEDLFYWDNDLNSDEERMLKIHPNAFTHWVFVDQGQDQNIVTNFQNYASDKLTPSFNADYSEVRFSLERGGDDNLDNLKISKGEESNFIWSIFYTLLKEIVEALEEDESTFDNLTYVFIDDPVSSLDDNHLIELAVDIANLVKSSQSKLKFIITTHNPLFYNVLSNEFNNKLYKNIPKAERELLYRPKESQKYRLVKKSDGSFELIVLGNNIPFSYHLSLLSEIKKAIDNDQIKKYHFNFLRNILEKTATFLGYKDWVELLPNDDDGNPDPLANRILNLSSHSAHAGEEISDVEENDKDKLRQLVDFLSNEYKFRQEVATNE